MPMNGNGRCCCRSALICSSRITCGKMRPLRASARSNRLLTTSIPQALEHLCVSDLVPLPQARHGRGGSPPVRRSCARWTPHRRPLQALPQRSSLWTTSHSHLLYSIASSFSIPYTGKSLKGRSRIAYYTPPLSYRRDLDRKPGHTDDTATLRAKCDKLPRV